jgi:hypothetical protein
VSNKVDNKLDFRNVKNSQFDPGQTRKMVFSEFQSADRVYGTNAILKDAYSHFIQQLDGEDRPTKVSYYQALGPAQDRIQFRADVGGDLAGTYFTLQEFITQKTHVFYYVVSGSGAGPGIGDIETPININTNDPASVVTLATKSVLNSLEEYIILDTGLLSSYIDIEYLQFGETEAVNVGTTGFMTSRIKEGSSKLVGEVELSYDVDGSPIYNGNKLSGLLYNPFTASFDVERDEITVSAVVSMDPVISKDPTVYNVSMPLANTEYSLSLPLQTKRFQMNIRDHKSKFTVSWTSGGAVLTKSPGTIYEESGLEIVTGKETIYFTATKDNLVMEIITWK